MKMNKKGSALALAVVLSAVLLMFGMGYAKLTRHTNIPTQKVDEHVRLQYLADGVAQIAMLKFKLFPSEFYAAWDKYETTNDETALNCFGKDAIEFQSSEFNDDQVVAFNSGNINASATDDLVYLGVTKYELLAGKEITTSSSDEWGKWGKGIISITTVASYTDLNGRLLKAESKITVQTTRKKIE